MMKPIKRLSIKSMETRMHLTIRIKPSPKKQQPTLTRKRPRRKLKKPRKMLKRPRQI